MKGEQIMRNVTKPTEGEWFEVKPQDINQKLFRRKRKDEEQERVRKIIIEAFVEMKENPEEYGRSFKTMMPEKTWDSKTVFELKKMACQLGDHNANWVEQALEWAQRIANGESWEAICDDVDTANWYRLVVWKYGYTRRVGGSSVDCDKYIFYTASCVHDNNLDDFDHHSFIQRYNVASHKPYSRFISHIGFLFSYNSTIIFLKSSSYTFFFAISDTLLSDWCT